MLNSYDQVPYLNRAHSHTHPDRLAALATLLGLQPACLATCRVLELGCSNGRNLLPMAMALPGAHFVGVDLSARQIADGQAAVAELGLTNLELRHASLADVDASYGLFDYILCHGVFSWVEASLQDKILAISRANLSDEGVAYVSYNIFPGWHDKLKVREMLLHQVRHITDPQVRIRKSREFISLMAELVAPPGSEPSSYGARLRSEAEIVTQQDDDYVFHEYLEDVNQPLYFHEFAERAARHGLQYLADADRGLRSLESLPAPVVEAMRQHADGIVAQEQLLDYYTNHTFRSTLLVPAGRHIDRTVTPARLRRLFVRSPLQAVSAVPDITGSSFETFGAADMESTFATAHPVTKAAMLVLQAAYPCALRFDDLVAAACARVYPQDDLSHSKVILTREGDILGRNLLQGHTADNNLIEFHAYAPRLATAPGDRPAALASARFEALRSRSVTNAYHRPVRLGSLSWYLLPFLDGTRDLAQLVELVLANQSLAVEKAGQELSDPDVKRPLLRAEVSSGLTALARAALILGDASS
jgi:methyltransferase-like protein/2-polyprenyl-3-methyl-5-hydroxy-6-metoxy-1,4-benzoquinol methylase